MMINADKKPLHNIRVIDFGQYIAAPATTMMLADLGAEVIHIDPPEGAMWDNPAAAMLNRGKQCIKLDLKSNIGKEQAIDLILSADVVVENFRPFVMQRLGLGAKAMRELNPQLIYASLPGFSSTDKKRRHIQAWEGVIAAACGQYSDMGLNRVLMGIEPSFSPLCLASGYAAVLATSALSFALYSRNKNGMGDTIEVPLAAALMEGLAYNSQAVEDYPQRYKSNREKEIDRRRETGEKMNLSYNELQELLDPFYRNYRCRDGRYLYIVSASHNKHSMQALKILGLWDSLVNEGLPLHHPYDNVADWGDDCCLGSYPLSVYWADKVSALIKQKLLQKTAYEWEQIFAKAFVPAVAQRTTQEWMNSPHANDSGLIMPVDDAKYGIMKQIGSLVWLRKNQHLYQSLSPRMECDIADIKTHKPNRLPAPRTLGKQGWLEGLKVLDITNVIAGPTIASTLARFGAEIINLDPTEPTMDPWNSIIFGMHAGRGKRSALINIKTDDGKNIFEKMLQWADVLTCNAVDSQLERLGLTLEKIKVINPKLILCQLDCYGGAKFGEMSNYPGYDDLAQAATGIMVRFGGASDSPEEHAHFGTIDVLGGFLGTVAIANGLIQRQQTGEGDIVRASLCGAGELIQAPFMYDFAKRQPFNEPSGKYIKGEDSLYRAYEANDGWFFLAMKRQDLRSLNRLLNIQNIDTLNDFELGEKLSQQFMKQSKYYWQENIQQLGLGIHTLDKMLDVRDNHLSIQTDETPSFNDNTFHFISHPNHPSGRAVTLVAPNAIRVQNATIRIPSAMPKPGKHTIEILSEFGYTTEQIKQMEEKQVIAHQWCDNYLPV